MEDFEITPELLKEGKEELELHKSHYSVYNSIADLTPTVCELCGVPAPDTCVATPIPCVIDQADKLMDGVGKTEKVLLFCPDAIGENQKRRCPDELARVKAVAGFEIPSASVMPSVTPVCYGAIFSGASPKIHGIQKYEKPVLKVQTLFDVFANAGKKVAILAINGCSIDTIFRKRAIDYFSMTSDEKVFDWTLKLIKEQEYDLIVSYMTNYDHQAHHTGIFSPESLHEIELAAQRFEAYAKAMDDYWKHYNRVLAFVPDHGQHPISDTKGGHGTDIWEDMLVNHYYRISEKDR